MLIEAEWKGGCQRLEGGEGRDAGQWVRSFSYEDE